NDPEKQYIRKLNFISLLTAFETIANGSFDKEDIKQYETIPHNSRSLYDLLLKNVKIKKLGLVFTTNLGINRTQVKSSDFRSVSYRGNVEELGDTELMFGYDEPDVSGMKLVTGKTKIMTRAEWNALNP